MQGALCYAIVMGFMFALADIPEVQVAIAQPLVPALALGMSALAGSETLSWVAGSGILFSILGALRAILHWRCSFCASSPHNCSCCSSRGLMCIFFCQSPQYSSLAPARGHQCLLHALATQHALRSAPNINASGSELICALQLSLACVQVLCRSPSSTQHPAPPPMATSLAMLLLLWSSWRTLAKQCTCQRSARSTALSH